MTSADFLSPRRSLLARIPEVDQAADLLSQAADKLVAGEAGEARALLTQADLPALRAFARSAMSQVTVDIHRLRPVADLPPRLAPAERGQRTPSTAEKAAIFRRDGYRCRYCTCRIVLPDAQSVMSKSLPGAVTWGNTDLEMNAAFYTLKGVLDHIVPHAHGGGSGADNLVASCQPCNYGRGNWSIEQVGLEDPRISAPVLDDWDGLSRLLPLRYQAKPDVALMGFSSHEVNRPKPSRSAKGISIAEWLSGLSSDDQVLAKDLLETVESCRDLGVSWAARDILAVRVTAGGTMLTVIGVQQDGEVQVPWQIAGHKAATRSFAEILAASIPGAECYQTPKLWCVRKNGRPLRLTEFMQAQSGLRLALESLHEALTVGP